ncbi:helix-turn-helix domain-containing protein, partial [Nocardia vinacea]|uniref:helix-turn-helix domain-containing protein n=1 Tax=Nocardia vinacea TaxID=96468 RepID=UPI0033CCD7C5
RGRGRTGGRPPALTGLQVSKAREMHEERNGRGKRKYTLTQIAATFNVSRKTIYRNLAPGNPTD